MSNMDFIELEIILLLTLSNVLVALGIGFALFKNRLKSVFFDWASEFKDELLDEIKEKPELISGILAPVVTKLAKQYGVPEPGSGGKTLNLFGFKIPAEVVTMFAGKMLQRGAEKAIEASPFG